MNIGIEHWHWTLALDIGIGHWHWTLAFDIVIRHWHSPLPFNLGIRHWHSTLALDIGIRHWHLTLAFDIGIQPWHLTLAFNIDIQHWQSTSACESLIHASHQSAFTRTSREAMSACKPRHRFELRTCKFSSALLKTWSELRTIFEQWLMVQRAISRWMPY